MVGQTENRIKFFKFQSEHYIQNIVANVWESKEPLYQCSGVSKFTGGAKNQASRQSELKN